MVLPSRCLMICDANRLCGLMIFYFVSMIFIWYHLKLHWITEETAGHKIVISDVQATWDHHAEHLIDGKTNRSTCAMPNAAKCCLVAIKELTRNRRNDPLVAIYVEKKLQLQWRSADNVILRIVHENCSTSYLSRDIKDVSTFARLLLSLPKDTHVIGVAPSVYGTYLDKHRLVQQLHPEEGDFVAFVYCERIQGASKGLPLSFTKFTNAYFRTETCFPTNLPINLSILSFEEITRLHPGSRSGGSWWDVSCEPLWRVAVVVPYRQRTQHLHVFLNHMHTFMRQQNVHYTMYIVEHTCPTVFNRAALMNIGFVEAMKEYKFDCFFMVDVDLLPERPENLYHCGPQPRHLVVTRNRTHYHMFSQRYFGGGVMFTPEHMYAINGFSNKIYGWGGEDNNAYHRVLEAGLSIERYRPEVASYTMLSHGWDDGNPRNYYQTEPESNDQDKQIPYIWDEDFHPENDGLTTLQYTIEWIHRIPLFTHILTTIPGPALSNPALCVDSRNSSL